MKKRILTKALATILLAGGLFAFKTAFSKTTLLKPVIAWGCRYTGWSWDTCAHGGYSVYNCTSGSTSCGYDPAPTVLE